MSANASSQCRAPERYRLARDLEISRLVTGLWQVADMERDRGPLDAERASAAMLDYARAGFDSFDMADHYGSAELIAGRLLARVSAGELPGRAPPAGSASPRRPSPGGVRARPAGGARRVRSSRLP